MDPGTKILKVSSNRQPRKKNDQEIALPSDAIIDDIFLGEDLENSFFAGQYIDDSHSHSLAYMASVLEAKIIGGKHKLIKCEDCVAAFIQNELIDDSFIRFKARSSNIMQPCRSTFEICKTVDDLIKSCEERSYQAVVIEILMKLEFRTLYPSSNFENHALSKSHHKYEFVKKIIELYMNIKSVHIAKLYTLKIHDDPMRHTFRKLIHERGE